MNRRHLSTARFLGIPLALIALTVGVVAAPPAHAASLGMVLWSSSLSPASISDAQAGDTFDFDNSSGSTVLIVDGTGQVLMGGSTSCANGSHNCYVSTGVMQSFTVATTGTILITDGSFTLATLTLGGTSVTSGGTPTAAELPGAPTNLSLTGGNGLITATWSAPTSSGSGPISKYEVSSSSGGNEASVMCAVPAGQTSCAFTGSNGVVTTVTVKAYNDQGWGPGATGTVTPTTSATCTNLSVDVAQPSSGAVTSPLTQTTSVVTMPYVAVPYGGSVTAAAIGTYTPSTNEGAMGGDYATFTPRLTGSCWIDVTIGEGAKLSLSTSVAPSAGSQALRVGPGQAIYVFGTKTGTYDVNFAIAPPGSTTRAGTPRPNDISKCPTSRSREVRPAGDLSFCTTAKGQVRIGTPVAAAYTITANPTTASLDAGGLATTDFVVNDAFGNAVRNVELTMAASGEVLLAGFTTSGAARTDSNGKVTQTYIAGNSSGSGVVTAAGAASNSALAWATGYTKPAAFSTAPVSTAATTITVTAASQTPTIAIVGSRGTADGSLPSSETCRSYAEGPPARTLTTGCVMVEGVTTGLAEGTAVTPEYRFPGQTSYTQGIDVNVDANGEFTWYRKTGKKIYIRFVSGANIVSSRVIIPAK